LAIFILVIVTGCTFQLMGPVFLHFFSKFCKVLLLGVSIRLISIRLKLISIRATVGVWVYLLRLVPFYQA